MSVMRIVDEFSISEDALLAEEGTQSETETTDGYLEIMPWSRRAESFDPDDDDWEDDDWDDDEDDWGDDDDDDDEDDDDE